MPLTITEMKVVPPILTSATATTDAYVNFLVETIVILKTK